MIDFIVRDCGAVGYLGIVVDLGTNTELWRSGSHFQTLNDAFNGAVEAWVTDSTHNIKVKKGLIGGEYS